MVKTDWGKKTVVASGVAQKNRPTKIGGTEEFRTFGYSYFCLLPHITFMPTIPELGLLHIL